MKDLAHGITELLVPFFLAGIGLHLNLSAFTHLNTLGLMGAILIAAISGKLLGCGLGAIRLGWTDALRIGVGMVPRGEMGLVVAQFGARRRGRSPDLRVHVASVAGLTLLKLAAWDRGRESNKDAADLYRLLTSCADAGNTNRVYEQELNLLESVGFDMRLAGAELLARDVASICATQILNQVQSVLALESNRERLVIDIVRTSTYAEARSFVERTLSGFSRGLGVIAEP